MLKRTQYLPCLLSFFIVSGASASGVEVGIGYAGYENPTDIDDSKGPKITLGHRYDSAWGIELSHADIDAVVENNKNGFTHTSLNTLYHLSDGSLQPYFLGGVGGYAGNGALNLGIGLKQRMGNFLLRPEIGLVKSLSKSNGSDTLHSTASLSLSYMFGASSKKMPMPIMDKTPAPSDSDSDGIVDTADRCPESPRDVTVDVNGCPIDSDSDGIADYMDKCPETQAGLQTNEYGCPVTRKRDSDNDGISDSMDQCPNTQGGLKTNDNGCPVKLTKDVSISLNVLFTSGSIVVSPEYFNEIAKAAAFLKQYENTTVVIEGHTDTRGSATFNKRLSQKRAEAVAKALVREFRIDPTRVKSIGYGEEQPIADESTQEGLLKNRRVVANIKAVIESFEQK